MGLAWALAVSAPVLLAGCAGAEATQEMPAQAQSALATINAPPDGAFDCGYPLGSAVYGRPRGLTLHPNGEFEFFNHDDPADREEGRWTHAAELHQIGFAGESSLDYAYYDIGASQLIVVMKPAEDGRVANMHCIRAETDKGG